MVDEAYMEFIKAKLQNLQKILEARADMYIDKDNWNKATNLLSFATACSGALELLKEQEAKTGKWILDDEDANSWECSECGGLLLINDGTPHYNYWHFCPYCGSKLEEQEVKWDE